MPKLNGLEVLAEIRGHQSGPCPDVNPPFRMKGEYKMSAFASSRRLSGKAFSSPLKSEGGCDFQRCYDTGRSSLIRIPRWTLESYKCKFSQEVAINAKELEILDYLVKMKDEPWTCSQIIDVRSEGDR